ncbi:MAG: phosphoenolpyruvate carboxykinase (ATP) [Spirochaetales bacterium]|nr:phosphoenolpyruvate carboxykinase (ATP) [Spirochaetales bacterium]
MDYHQRTEDLLKDYKRVVRNPERKFLIEESVVTKAAMALPVGTLVTWTPPESTGRSPKDTYIVKRPASEKTIDWDSPNNVPLDPDTFSMLTEDALALLSVKKRVYALDRVVGADTNYALPVLTVTDNSLSGLFVDNMFRKVPGDIGKSAFAGKPFLLLALPYEKLDKSRYQGKLRKMEDGSASNLAVAMDFDNRIGIVFGSAYMGSIKKLIFTVMNYYLPDLGILPLHCSANEGPDGKCALLLGLSGTGKTTLSADPERSLVGDDEHGWSDNGVANFENGCYAKLINLNPEKEPEIFKASFHADHYLSHGSIVENVMVYPDGTFDLDDDRFTPNSRVSYPLRYLSNYLESAKTGHPSTVLFLTADAYGVLPPISRLTADQAKLWFMMGYTSKLAGTETGVTEPQATFSRFFGQPFMPRNPEDYTNLLEKYTEKYETSVFLVNTGWSGGPFGVGKRMDINATRAMVRAAMNGSLDKVEYTRDPVFKVEIPLSCPGVDSSILVPKNTWQDKAAFDKMAEKLAGQFKAYFNKAFAGKVEKALADQCPGM